MLYREVTLSTQRNIKLTWKDLVAKIQSCDLCFWITMPVIGQPVSKFWGNRMFRDKCVISKQSDAASNPRKRKPQLPLQKPKISQSAEL